ncbi:hypothetical protein LINPERPRIM_LOCUS13299 [Linum perenne]
MADAISPMDIDHTDEKLNQNSSSKGKSIVVDGVAPPGNKATPWVESTVLSHSTTSPFTVTSSTPVIISNSSHSLGFMFPSSM